MRHLLPAVLTVLAALLSPHLSHAAPPGQDMRVAVYAKDENLGVKRLGSKQVNCFKMRRIEFEFSVNGGQVRGFQTYKINDVYTIDKIGLDQLLAVESKDRIEGEFEGGDGGALRGRLVDLEDNSSEPFTGKLFANGTGYMVIGKQKYALSFAPLAACKAELNAYEAALRNEIMQRLLDLASKKLFDQLVLAMNTAGDKALQSVMNSKYLSGGYKAKLSDGKAVWDRLTRHTNQIIPDNSLQMMQEVTTALSFLEAADAALDGAYQDAAKIAVLELIALKSNAAGLLIAAAQAVKADWDAFCQRWNEHQFRKFYLDLYHDGPRPKDAAAFLDKENRLRAFMEMALEYLSTNDSARGRPFRKMLIDYASINLNQSFSYADFDVVEQKGALKMSNRAAATVLGALFNDYEKVYINDLRTEKFRRIAIQQGKAAQQELRRMNSAMAWAVNGNFKEVWDAKAYNSVFCSVLAELQASKPAR